MTKCNNMIQHEPETNGLTTESFDGNHPIRDLVLVRDTGQVQPLDGVPRLSSVPLGWNGYLVEQYQMPPSEPREVIWMRDVVLLQQGSPVTVEFKQGRRFVPRQILPGRMSLRPARSCTAARCEQPADLVLVALDPGFLSVVCPEAVSTHGLELPLEYGVEDPFVEGVCLALRDEVARGGRSGQLYSESLATSLAMHLASRYTRRGSDVLRRKDQISPRKVRQAMEFIRDRLHQDISLKEIAAAVGLSPFHFARLFKRSTGLAPHQYLIRQRVERARQLLLRGELSQAAIAGEVGFCDASHLSMHFKRVCGCTPRAYVEQTRTIVACA